MNVVLARLTNDNFEQVVSLRVKETQKDFVQPNLYSIAQAKMDDEIVPLTIYADDKLVGFCMYGIGEDDGRLWIHSCMIDEQYQGQGYAKAAVKELLKRLREKRGATAVWVTYDKENEGAHGLFESIGFVPDGQNGDRDLVAVYNFS